MRYDQALGPLPGEQWEPSNGTEGEIFIGGNCAECERDREEDCEVLAASFRGEAIEWREFPDGQVKCVLFVDRGERIPERCPRTKDLFGVT
jgi:hypothetical protein